MTFELFLQKAREIDQLVRELCAQSEECFELRESGLSGAVSRHLELLDSASCGVRGTLELADSEPWSDFSESAQSFLEDTNRTVK